MMGKYDALFDDEISFTKKDTNIKSGNSIDSTKNNKYLKLLNDDDNLTNKDNDDNLTNKDNDAYNELKRITDESIRIDELQRAVSPAIGIKPYNKGRGRPGGRGLFGLDPETEAGLFPKASRVSGTGAVGTNRPAGEAMRQNVQAAMDFHSILGRAVAAGVETAFNKPKVVGTTYDSMGNPIDVRQRKTAQYLESFGRPEALPKENPTFLDKVGSGIENAVRDPITALMMTATGGGSLAAKPIEPSIRGVSKFLLNSFKPFVSTKPPVSKLGKIFIEYVPKTIASKVARKSLGEALKTAAKEGAIAQIVPAIARQVSTSAESGKVTPGQVPMAAAEVVAGGLGNAVGTGIHRAIPTSYFMKLALKVKDRTAKKAGVDVKTGINNIVNTINDFNLESTPGGVGGIAKNAGKAITKQKKIADGLIENYIKERPYEAINVDDQLLNLMDDIFKGREISVFSHEAAAAQKVANIHEALALRGLTGPQPIIKLPEIKATISEGLGLFDKGPYRLGQNIDPLDETVGELAYHNIKKALESKVPGIKVPNKNIFNLINAMEAAQEAADRTYPPLRMMDLVSSGTKRAVGMSPEMSLITGILEKLGQRGRGASALMTASRLPVSDATRVAFTNLRPEEGKKYKVNEMSLAPPKQDQDTEWLNSVRRRLQEVSNPNENDNLPTGYWMPDKEDYVNNPWHFPKDTLQYDKLLSDTKTGNIEKNGLLVNKYRSQLYRQAGKGNQTLPDQEIERKVLEYVKQLGIDY